MKFKGKIAVWFWAVFILGNGVILYELLTPGGEAAAGVIGIVVFNLVFLPIMIRNYVILEGDTLTVCFGIGKDSIHISEIVEVYQTHNPIASSAASLDRIVLKGRRQEMMCSVVDKRTLLHELEKRNPRIVIHKS